MPIKKKIILFLGKEINKIKSFCYNFLREYDKTRFASFGKDSTFGHHCVFSYPTIYVGEHVYIGPNCLFRSIHGTIHIGNHVMFGPGVHIHGGNHIYNCAGKYMDEATKEIGADGDLVIEDDVWVGANAIVLRGSHIGRGAIIGAGTIVRSEVPPYAIVVGIPSRIVGFRFTPDVIIKHEEVLYSPDKRLSKDLLERNYKVYSK